MITPAPAPTPYLDGLPWEVVREVGPLLHHLPHPRLGPGTLLLPLPRPLLHNYHRPEKVRGGGGLVD